MTGCAPHRPNASFQRRPAFSAGGRQGDGIQRVDDGASQRSRSTKLRIVSARMTKACARGMKSIRSLGRSWRLRATRRDATLAPSDGSHTPQNDDSNLSVGPPTNDKDY